MMKISAEFKEGNSVLRDKGGNILTKEKDIQKRWKKYFEKVLNRKPPNRPVKIEKRRVNEEIRCEESSQKIK